MKLDIYGDGISYVTDEVSSIPTNESNANEENRIKYVTDLASVSRSKSESNNPPKRYKALLKEASPTEEQIIAFNGDGKMNIGSPSRPLEFLPVVVDLMLSEYSIWNTNYDYNKQPIFTFSNFADLSNGLLQHSYIEPICGNNNLVRLYTNMRAIINSGIPYESVPYNSKEELKHFRALKANIPMFVWSQVPNTHCALSKEAQSDRVTENVNYWLPNDLLSKVYKYTQNGNKNGYTYTEYEELSMKILLKPNRNDIVNLFLSTSQNLIQAYLKAIGYPREIYSRAIYYFKYKEVVFTGWVNNPKTFKHLFIERNNRTDLWSNWTQDETRQFVSSIKGVIRL